MDVNQYYQKGRYQVTKNDREEIEVLYTRRVKLFKKLLQGYDFTTVLDAGCGDGEIARLFKKQTGTDVYGIDISKKGVALAREKGIHAKVADMAVKIPYKDKMFDLVISS